MYQNVQSYTHTRSERLSSLGFFSECTHELGLMGLMRLLFQSYLNNKENEITGALFYDGRNFSQIMEGPEVKIDECWQAIRKDRRHTKIHLVGKNHISSRAYSTWSMRVKDGGVIASMYPELVDIIGEINSDRSAPEIARAAYSSARIIQELPVGLLDLPTIH